MNASSVCSFHGNRFRVYVSRQIDAAAEPQTPRQQRHWINLTSVLLPASECGWYWLHELSIKALAGPHFPSQKRESRPFCRICHSSCDALLYCKSKMYALDIVGGAPQKNRDSERGQDANNRARRVLNAYRRLKIREAVPDAAPFLSPRTAVQYFRCFQGSRVRREQYAYCSLLHSFSE